MKNYLALLFVASTLYCEGEQTSKSAVYLSCPSHTFEFYGSALWLKPTGGTLNYAVEAIALPVPSPNWRIHEITTHYHPGFDIGIRGIIHSTHSNLNLNWQRLHSKDTASKKVDPSNMIGPFFEIGPDASPYKRAHGQVRFKFDEVNLTYGIFVNFGSRLATNLFTGVSFVSIQQILFSKYSNNSKTIVRTIKVPSRYKGTGPELGLGFSYRMIEGLRFTGGAAAALLVGKQKNHTDYRSYSPALADVSVSPPNKQSTKTGDRTQVVPALKANLGLAYLFTCCKRYKFKIETGYQAQIYFNAIQSIDIGSEVITPPVTPDTIGVYARTFHKTLSNFALTGPYLKANIGF